MTMMTARICWSQRLIDNQSERRVSLSESSWRERCWRRKEERQRDPVNDSRAAPAAAPRFGSSWFLSWPRGEPSLLIGSARHARVCDEGSAPPLSDVRHNLFLLRKRRSPWQRMNGFFLELLFFFVDVPGGGESGAARFFVLWWTSLQLRIPSQRTFSQYMSGWTSHASCQLYLHWYVQITYSRP